MQPPANNIIMISAFVYEGFAGRWPIVGVGIGTGILAVVGSRVSALGVYGNILYHHCIVCIVRIVCSVYARCGAVSLRNPGPKLS